MLPIILFIIGLIQIVCGEYIPPGPKYRCPDNPILIHPCKCVANGENGINVECVNTNLATMSIGLNNLASYKLPIEELVLDQCNIGRLYGTLFHKLKIRILKIKNTPIESIDEHTFHGTNKTLNELYITNTTLNEFPKLAFRILGNLTILNIDQHAIKSLATDAFGGSEMVGKLQRLHVTNGNISELPIETLTPLRKLKVLDLHGNQLSELKRNQFRGLRDTESLDLSYNNLKKIDSSHLADLTKLSFCNVSHNSLTELTRGAFARNAVLRVLNMSFNKIRRLDANSFRGMRFLRRLYLSDNEITDVGRGTFGSITRIGTIDLARNQIKKIDYQMFYQLNYAEVIDVSENSVTEIQKLSFKDLYLTTINLSHNAIDKIEVNAFENCANITLLDLSYNQIKTIPKRAFDDTTYANELQLSYNLLEELNQIPLHNMTGLRILNASHNNIVTVPRQTFPKLYELHTIDLSHNNLSDIANGVFQTLFSLRMLNISYNNMSSIKPSTFGTIPTLLELDISHNYLKDVARSAFAKFSSTRVLKIQHNQLERIFQLPISVGEVDFSYNRLTNIPEKVWPTMNAVLSLNFRGNQFGNNLEKGSFGSLLTLRNLDLSDNGISEIPWQALSDLTSLQYLYLENNNITRLRRAAFGRLPVVFELNLANNQINNISSRAFDGLLQLLTLNLTNNDVTYIPNDAFHGLVSLRTLDLSKNRIEKMDNKTNGILEDCLSLERINLSHNKLSFITRKTFPSSPWIPYKLKEIDLSYNGIPILTYDLVFGTGKVQYLNLSHNSITEFRKGVIGNLTSLQVLDLSYNELEDITTEADIFNLPANISELYLANNKLKQIPMNIIKKASKLKHLDLSYNQLSDFNHELVTMIKNNDALIDLNGNPLDCNCLLRPLKKYMDQTLALNDTYRQLECALPLQLAGQTLHEISDDRLNCVQNIDNKLKMSMSAVYDVTSDIKFRDVKFSSKKISVRWLVNNIIDIADFYIVIRKNSKTIDANNNIVYETNLPYWTRLFELNIEDESAITNAINANDNDLQLCVLARDSLNNVRNWFKNQCTMFPSSHSLQSTSSAPPLLSFNMILIVISTLRLCM